MPIREARKKFEEDFPLGYIEHRRAFGKDGRYGRWITKHNTAIKINGIIFSHGDWSEEYSKREIDEVNKQVRQELSGELPVEGGIIFDVLSPLQYRGFANTKLTRAAQQAEEPRIDRTLANLGASRMVVGHTLTPGLIESRFGGKHISLDVGMLNLYRGGHRIALEIEGDELRSIHDGGKVPIPLNLDESTLDDYVRAVAKVDPTNVDVQLKFVDMLGRQGLSDASALILEKLFAQNPTTFPFATASILESTTSTKATRRKPKSNSCSISAVSPGSWRGMRPTSTWPTCSRAFASTKVSSSSSPRKRFGTRSHGRLELQFQANSGSRASRENAYREALAVLTAFPEANGVDYDVHYLTGLAYLGLDDREKAKTAFEDAVGAEASRDEAKRELKKLEGISEDPPALDKR